MKILIAEDDAVCRSVIERMLKKWGHEVVVACDGLAAWQILQREDAPKLAILDWLMPEMSGLDVCRKARDLVRQEPTYVILLTVKDRKEDVVVGLESGADDFIPKPFDEQELRSRIRVGERMVVLPAHVGRPRAQTRSRPCRSDHAARPFAHLLVTARRSATTRITGTMSKATSRPIRISTSATGYARLAGLTSSNLKWQRPASRCPPPHSVDVA